MWDLKACTVCLSTDGKLCCLDIGNLRNEYNLISGLKTRQDNGLPGYLCVECSAYVQRFVKFRNKCQRAYYALQEILRRKKEITKLCLKKLDRNSIGIMPSLSYVDRNKTHYERVKFQWVKLNRINTVSVEVPVIQHSTNLEDSNFVLPKQKCKILMSDETEIKQEVDDKNNTTKILQEDINCGSSKENYFPMSSDMAFESIDDYFEHDDNINNGNDDVINDDSITYKAVDQTPDNVPDGSNLDEEYASMIPLVANEATAAVEVYKMFSQGRYRCEVCSKGYQTEKRLKIHLRMHDKHVSGTFFCELCHYYYKTEFLLKTHMTEKHLYKYVCKKCPEVNFDRISAKQHYIWTHLQKGNKKNANWYDNLRPSWLSSKGGKRIKGVVSIRPVRKIKKLPKDFLVYSPIRHEEQYALILDRQKTRNYMEALFKCNLCFRGFREVQTYNKHMKKHDPATSGELQCDMCKLHFKNARKMYKHMIITHIYKYSCQLCSFVCYNRGQAHMHYRWHKNVTYKCPHCDREFKKASTRLTHIRIKHPSTNICNLCGHSFVSETGLYCHKRIAHRQEEIDSTKSEPMNTEDPLYCSDCNIQFVNDLAFDTHLGSSNKHAVTNLSIKPVRTSRKQPGRASETGDTPRRPRGRPRHSSSEILNNGAITATDCEVCGISLSNDVQARKHYQTEHPGYEYLKRYMCDVCGHTTKQYANLLVHMRTHTQEKPYECPHCDRRFSMTSNRDRHLVVHTGEKRYQCQHCHRRFTQSSAVKLHIQTVHLKIPYAPWDKKNRKRRKELQGDASAMTAINSFGGLTSNTHLQAQHKLLLESQGEYLNAYITYNDD